MNKKMTLSIISDLEAQKEALERTIFKLKVDAGIVDQDELGDYMDDLMTNFYKKPAKDKFDFYVELNNLKKEFQTETDILEDMKKCIK
ncbi:MAG: hypothetical protein ACRCX8_18500 [Sarcina sp.]